MAHSSNPHRRTIRSFVRREGRITEAQQRAFDTLWTSYGIDFNTSQLEFDTIFSQSAPITLEIGFGNGESLATMAQTFPERNFIGIEVHRPGVGHLLQILHEQDINNLRILCHDAVDVLANCIPTHSIDCVQLFFPDPWPKKRHHKRRLVQSGFIQTLGELIKPGGTLHMATDWPPYAEHMIAVLDASDEFANTAKNKGCLPRPDYRPETKFERRGINLDHPVCDLIFRRQ